MDKDITDLPVGPNKSQQNADQFLGDINSRVRESMGVLPETGPAGRHFLNGEHKLFGYNGVVVTDGKIVSLLNLDPDEDVPTINLGAEVVIEGNSMGYVSSGHKPGDKVKVIGFVEPFFKSGKVMSSDKIIQVEGGEEGVVGWIKPSEVDKNALREQNEKEIKKLFDTPEEK